MAQIAYAFRAASVSRRSEEQLEEQIKRVTTTIQEYVTEQFALLPAVVRTQPAKEFLFHYGTAMRVILVAFEKFRTAQTVTPDSARHLLNVILQHIAVLAQEYEKSGIEATPSPSPSGGSAPTFSANLMVFVPVAELGERKKWIKFADDLDINSFGGALVLLEGLYATARADDGNSPPEAIALLVPREGEIERTEGRSRALPGAPLAFARRKMEIVSDTSEMGDWIREHGDFGPSCATAVDTYFQALTRLSGFISMPATRPEGAEPVAQREVLGVVNVDWSSARLLRESEPAKLFYLQMAPFLAIAAMVLDLHRDALLQAQPPSSAPKEDAPAVGAGSGAA